MKIAHIITRSDNIGGAQVYLRDLAVALQSRGHNIDILVGGAGPFFKEMKEYGVPIHSLRHLIRPIQPYHDIMAFWEIRRLLHSLAPDLVVAHTSKAGWIGRIAAWSLGIPAVFTAHGWSFIQVASNMLARLYILAEKIAGLVTCRAITVSEYDRCFCIQHRMLPAHKVTAIQNGVPDTACPTADYNTDSLRLIMTARLEKPKNHLFLLNALAPLKELDWQLYLVGDGPMHDEVEEYICRLGLSHRVRLLGTRRDVPQLLSSAQVFVLSSDMEGLPLSILEAMRAGLPVIATDVGGVSELVEDGVNGFLVPTGSTELFTARLSSLISNRELRRQMGCASLEKYRQNFRLNDMVDKTLAVYSEVSVVALRH